MKKNKKDNKLVNTILMIGIVFLLASLVLMLTRGRKIPNHIVDIKYEEYSEIIKEEEYNIIILTSPTCSHCKNYKPRANFVADDYHLTIYNLDISNLTYEQYIEIHDKYKATKDNYIDGKPSVLTPTTIITKNGEEIDSISNNLGYDGLLELLKKYEIVK